MTVAAGLSAIKTGFELVKGLREILKKDGVDPHEVSNRLMEIQEFFLEAQNSLMEAQEENRGLREQLDTQDRLKEIEADLELTTDGYFYVRKSEQEKGLIPYCPVCWGKECKLVPMAPASYPGTFRCAEQEVIYCTAVHSEWLKQEQDRQRRQTPVRSNWMGSF
jgi:hypothetical protein